MISDRNALDILTREEAIKRLLSRIGAEGSDDQLVLDSEKIVLISYANPSERPRIGIVDYGNDPSPNEEGLEYIFVPDGLEGIRKAAIERSADGRVYVNRESSFRQEQELPDGLPALIRNLIPQVSGYQAGFGGMFASNSDSNPLVEQKKKGMR